MSIIKKREQIDAIDKKILALISERAGLAKAIGQIKHKEITTVYNPTREIEIMEKLMAYNLTLGDLSNENIKAIFTEIISACRALEKRPRIAYLGPDGSFSHFAALKQFGSSAEFLPQPSINTTFAEMSKGHADYAILPIENSVEGMVNNTLDELMTHNLSIIAELYIPIELCVMVSAKTVNTVLKGKSKLPNKSTEALAKLTVAEQEQVLRSIKEVYSHPQPFGQSRSWLERHLPKVTLTEMSSTSAAAAFALKKVHTASIGSRQLLQVFPDLYLAAERIEDNVHNTTRFVVLAKSGQKILTDKNIITSMMISIKDRPGALHQILAIFARYRVNLTNLVSRPSKRRAFDYAFYLDCEGNVADSVLKKILNKITPYIVEVKILGCFPRGQF